MIKTVFARMNGTGQVIRARCTGGGCEITQAAGEQTPPGSGAHAAIVPANDVVFYRIVLPAARPELMDKMIRLQVEALAPLPLDELAVAWQAHETADGKREVTVAVARTTRLREMTGDGAAHADYVIPSAQGVVAAASRFFACNAPENTILYVSLKESQLCVVRGQRLRYATPLDAKLDQILRDGRLQSAPAQRLYQDIVRAIGDDSTRKICLLCPDEEQFAPLGQFLRDRGCNVQMAAPQLAKLSSNPPVTPSWLYEHAPLLGGAVAAADDITPPLNLVQNAPAQHQKPRWRLPPSWVSAIAAAVMAVAFIAAGYAADHSRLDQLRTKVADLEHDETRADRRLQLILRQEVARRRTPPLDVIRLITSEAPEGALLDKIELSGKREVALSGRIPDEQGFYAYQETLQGRKEVSKLRGRMESFDDKAKTWKFTITFVYNSNNNTDKSNERDDAT